MSIIPTVKSKQPSGQSVLLQSMSMMVPVLITYHENFWGSNIFEDKKDIIYVKNKEDWSNAIAECYRDDTFLEHITKNAYETLKSNFDQAKLFKSFKSILLK